MSTIQAQVKKKLFERFRVQGFVSLVRSADLLKDVMSRLGLVRNKIDTSDGKCDIVELKLGKAHSIFNSKNNEDFYCFALRGDNHTPLVKVYIRINGSPLKSELSKVEDNNLIDFNVYMYHNKGPPLVSSS